MRGLRRQAHHADLFPGHQPESPSSQKNVAGQRGHDEACSHPDNIALPVAPDRAGEHHKADCGHVEGDERFQSQSALKAV